MVYSKEEIGDPRGENACVPMWHWRYNIVHDEFTTRHLKFKLYSWINNKIKTQKYTQSKTKGTNKIQHNK